MDRPLSTGQMEERYRFIFTEARDGIVLTECDNGLIVDCNPEFERQTGRPLDVLKTLSIWALRPSDKVEAARKKFEEVCSIGIGGSDELEYLRPNGDTIPIEFQAKKVKLGNRCFILSITRDITERRLLERELANYHEHLEDLVQTRTDQLRKQAKQLEQYEFFFNNCNDGIGIVDCSTLPTKPGLYLEVNDTLSKMLGYSRAELLSLSPTDLNAPEILSQHLARIGTLKPGDKRLFETVYMTKHGQRFPIEITVHLCELNGRLTALKVYRDIKLRKAMEAQISKHLSREAGLRKREQRLRKKLEQQLESLSQFIRSLVHEIRTPLTPIKAAAEELEHQSKTAEQLLLTKQVRAGCERINKRTGELFDVFKGELGVLTLRRRRLDMGELLDEIFLFWSEEAKYGQIEFVREWPEKLPLLYADGERIQTAIDNLLSNAFKFTPAGGRVSMLVLQEENRITVEIADTGCGIKPDQLPHVFDAYYSNRSGGLGLGLYLSKLIIDLHSGKIWIDKTECTGTTVKFSLPLVCNEGEGAVT